MAELNGTEMNGSVLNTIATESIKNDIEVVVLTVDGAKTAVNIVLLRCSAWLREAMDLAYREYYIRVKFVWIGIGNCICCGKSYWTEAAPLQTVKNAKEENWSAAKSATERPEIGAEESPAHGPSVVDVWSATKRGKNESCCDVDSGERCRI